MGEALITSLDPLYAAFDLLLLVGLCYLLARGWRTLRSRWRECAQLATIPALFFASLWAWQMFGTGFHERYLRPVLPLAAIFAGIGYHRLARDIGRRWAVYPLFGIIFLAAIVFALQEPLRAHRHPQTEAGRWLRRADPVYHGLVISDYSQPAYYAETDYVPPDAMWQGWYERHLGKTGAVKYFILERPSPEERTWAHDYVKKHDWPVIFYDAARKLRIYRNPGYRPANSDTA